jgi:hypothetical protein
VLELLGQINFPCSAPLLYKSTIEISVFFSLCSTRILLSAIKLRVAGLVLVRFFHLTKRCRTYPPLLHYVHWRLFELRDYELEVPPRMIISTGFVNSQPSMIGIPRVRPRRSRYKKPPALAQGFSVLTLCYILLFYYVYRGSYQTRYSKMP